MKSANTFLRIVLAAMLFVDAFRVIPLISDTTSEHYGNTNSVQTVYAWDDCVTDADCSDGIVCTSDVCNSNWLCSNPLACAPWETCDGSNGYPVCTGSTPIDAVCGSWFLSCSAGNPGNPNDTVCGQDDTWDCFGVNGWADAWCMIPDVCSTPPVNGDCGNAYGVCVTGQAANRNDSACGTDDTWTCEGSNGGSSDSCSVPDVCTTTPTNAVCGSTFGSCSAGNSGNLNDTVCGQDDTWDCFGTDGWTDAWCMIPDVCSPTPVNGDCGLTVGQCDAGTANNINDTVCTQNDTWECVWSNGGTTVSCAHNDSCGGGNPIPWVCGAATGTCTLWIPVGVNDTACNQADTWSCTGSGWGATASCSNPDLCSGTDWTCGVVFGSCTNGTAWNYNQTACNTADTWTCSWTNGGSTSSCSVPDPCGWWGLCVPQIEICDGIDNDCDNLVDEDLDTILTCSVWVWACAAQWTRWRICEDGVTNTYQCNAVPWTPSAEICDDGIDNDCDGEVDEVACPVDTYDLALRKTLSGTTPGPFMAGDMVTFNVRVFNQGDVNASDIVVTDYIPAGLTFVSSNATTISTTANSVDLDFGAILAWSSKVRTITFTIDNGFSGTIDNLAEISSDNGNDVDSTTDTNSWNDVLVNDVINNNGGDEDDHDIESITVDPIISTDEFDLALRKTVNSNTPGPFMAGDTVTFNVRVINQGDIDATGIQVMDYIPAGLTYVSSNAAIANTATSVTMDFGSILAWAAKTRTITFTIDSGFSGTIDNLAEIIADNGNDVDSTTDTNSSNDVLIDNVINNNGGDEDDHDIETIIVDPIVVPNGYDLALRKTRMAATYAPGDTVTFNIRVFNQGTVDANNVEVTDYIPSGVTYVSTSATEIATTATTATLWFPMIPVGGSVLETITFTIDDNFTGTIDNKAEISSDDGNDIDSTTDVDMSNDVLVNNVIDNTDWDEDDHDNAIITVIDPINPVYDLALSKDIATAGPYAPGDVVNFDITVTNEGTVPSGAFTVVDYIPAGFTFAWTNATSYTLVWSDLVLDYPSIQVWGAATITVSMLIDSGFTGSSITNKAEVMTDNGNDVDSIEGNESMNEDDDDVETIAIDTNSDTYDLALRKTRLWSTTTYAPGDTVTFNIRVINQWSVAANNVEVTDYIPAGLTYVSTTATEIATTATTATLWFATIPVNGSVLETITFTVDAWANGTIENIAEISSDDGNDVDSVTDTLVNNDVLINNVIDNAWWDEDDHDNATIVVETVNPTTYDLALVKDVVTSGPYVTGQEVEFAITVTNEGNIPSGAFTVIDYIPAGFAFINSSSAYTQSWSDLIIDFANIPVWSSSTETVTMRGNGGFVWMSITNLAEVYTDNGNDTDSTEGNESTNEDDDDWETITIINDNTNTDEFDLALQKTLNASNSSPFALWSTVTFDITVINQGDLQANGVVVTDYIPAWLIFDSSSVSTLSVSSTEVALDFGSLAVWASRTETITFTIDSSFTGTTLDNIAEITADNGADVDSTTDSNPSNDTLLNDVINNSGGDEDDHDIESITITQVVCVDTGAEICDGIDNDCDGDIDEGTDELVACSAGLGECRMTGTQPNACINGEYVLGTCNAVAGTPENEVCEDGLDNDCDGLFDEQCGGTSYDLALMKVLNSSTTGPFEAGDTVTFDLTVLNESNENAIDVHVIDYVPAGLTFLSSSVWSNWTEILANGNIVLNFPPITVGRSETETISFIIDDGFAWVIENWSEIYTDDGVDVDSTPGNWSQNEDDDDNALITVTDPETTEFDLALSMGLNSATTWTFNPGDIVTFDISVFNQGTENAEGIEVIDYIPAGLTFLSSTAPVISNDATTVVLDYGSLVAWASTVETITFTVNSWFSGTIDNLAEIITDNGADIDSTTDTNSANDILVDDEINNAGNDEDDHDIETIVVTNPSTGSNDYDLALRKTSNSSTFVQGSQVIYTITVFNQWDINASSIEVTDYIPNGLTYVSSSASIISETDDEIVLDFGSIAAWDSESETITFTISSSYVGDIENIAEITSDNGNDIDSTTDTSSSNDVVVDDVINNSSNDEDDHDVEEIEVLLRTSWSWGWGSGWGRNYCGDGNLSVIRGEQCDDGNYIDGDWCSRNCQLEDVVDPVIEDPEVCQIESRCWDGIIWHNGDPTIKEQCDDGNTIDGDGCSSNCYIEVPTVVPTPVVIIQEPEPVEIELPFIPQPRYEQVPMPEPLQLPAYLPETGVLNGGLLKWRVSLPTLVIRKEEENKA